VIPVDWYSASAASQARAKAAGSGMVWACASAASAAGSAIARVLRRLQEARVVFRAAGRKPPLALITSPFFFLKGPDSGADLRNIGCGVRKD
jgi:hypothetical protein